MHTIFLYYFQSSHTKLAVDTKPENLDTLGWNGLVTLKRRLSGDLKELTDSILDIDRNQFHSIIATIKEHRALLDSNTERLKQIRAELERRNAELLAISEKISQSKNFLSIMEARLPSEKEEDLHSTIQSNQTLIELKNYKSEREKDEIRSRIKDASMKIEAIKATRTIKEQFAQLTQESTIINNSIKQLNSERDLIRNKIGDINNSLDKLYNSKRKLSSDRESLLAKYNEVAKRFEIINARLDAMAEMRRKQREEYGYSLPNDALFKVKEEARKKLEAGSKLSFDELKLLYGEKD
jgi:uncharacterized coiled-coil DUF342 family protein